MTDELKPAEPSAAGVEEPACISCMRDREDLYGEELAYIDSLHARLRKAEAEARIKGAFLSSRQCPDHNGKWEPGRCLQCELEQSAARLRWVFEQHDGTKATVADLCNYKQRLEQAEREVAWFRDACSVLGFDAPGSDTCNPLKERLAELLNCERDREALRKDAELLDWLEKNYHASEVDEYAAQGNARWVFSTPLLGSWAPLRARLRAALSASPGARE